MSNTLQSLIQETRAFLDKNTNEKAQVVNRWNKTGLLENLNPQDKREMAQLLENQMKFIISEAATTNVTNFGGATFNAGVGEQYASVLLPMVRKIYGDMVSAKNLISFQPINQPSGLIFYLDYKFATAKPFFDANSSVYGVTDIPDTAPTGGFYGSSKFGYSLNTITASAVATVTSASFQDVLFDSRLSGSVAAGGIKKVSVPISSLANPAIHGVMSFNISGSGAAPQGTLGDFTKVNGANIEFYSASPVVGGNVIVSYYRTTKDNDRGDFETRDTPVTLPKLKFEFKSDTINSETRKLAIDWSAEAMQDAKSYQQFDVEHELTNLMSEQVAMEIDGEVLGMLLGAVNETEYWSVKNNTEIKSDNSGFQPMTSGYYNSQTDWFKTLGTKIAKISANLLRKNLRGGVNWMVISPDVNALLQSSNQFVADTDAQSYRNGSVGVQKAGTFGNGITVYVSPYFSPNRMLVGYKGGTFLETGAVWSSYVPLIMTQAITDPEQLFKYSKGLMQRYGMKMVRKEFYGQIVIDGLESL